jgi:hypothetical protein
MGGEELPVVTELRYLGVSIDSRLSFQSHWTRVAASSKAAVGALARLVHRDPVALRHLYTERVTSVLLHSLPFLPPSTQKGWNAVNGVASFAGHLILNEWERDGVRIHGVFVTKEAGLISPSQLCFQQSMKFIYKCVFGRQRFGEWMEKEERVGRVRQLRSQQARTGLELALPATHLKPWTQLQPLRAILTYNALPYEAAGLDPIIANSTYKRFKDALIPLYASLPSEIASLYYEK